MPLLSLHHLHQPVRQRFRAHRDWTRDFAKYLGRSLSRPEKLIITPLERERHAKGMPRLMVVDPPGIDSKPLLMKYLAYVSEVVYGGRVTSLVCSRSKRRSKELAAEVGLRPIKQYWHSQPGNSTYMLGPRSPNAVRGCNFRLAVVLDIDRYGQRSAPRAGAWEWDIVKSRFNDIIRVVTAPTSVPGCSLLVYHSSSPVSLPPAFKPPDPLTPLGIERLPAPDGEDPDELLPVVISLSPDDSPDTILNLLGAFLIPGARQTTR